MTGEDDEIGGGLAGDHTLKLQSEGLYGIREGEGEREREGKTELGNWKNNWEN